MPVIREEMFKRTKDQLKDLVFTLYKLENISLIK